MVEYLLLMVIAIGFSTFLTQQLVTRTPEKPGIIITAWDKILKNIGRDVPDCENPDCRP